MLVAPLMRHITARLVAGCISEIMLSSPNISEGRDNRKPQQNEVVDRIQTRDELDGTQRSAVLGGGCIIRQSWLSILVTFWRWCSASVAIWQSGRKRSFKVLQSLFPLCAQQPSLNWNSTVLKEVHYTMKYTMYYIEEYSQKYPHWDTAYTTNQQLLLKNKDDMYMFVFVSNFQWKHRESDLKGERKIKMAAVFRSMYIKRQNLR